MAHVADHLCAQAVTNERDAGKGAVDDTAIAQAFHPLGDIPGHNRQLVHQVIVAERLRPLRPVDQRHVRAGRSRQHCIVVMKHKAFGLVRSFGGYKEKLFEPIRPHTRLGVRRKYRCFQRPTLSTQHSIVCTIFQIGGSRPLFVDDQKHLSDCPFNLLKTIYEIWNSQ